MLTRHRTAWLVAVPAILAVLVFGQSPALSARQDQLPTGREVIDRYVEAIGGAAAFAAVQSIRATGSVEVSAAGVSGTVELLVGRPNKMRVNSEIAGVGMIMRGYDGAVGWSMDPMAGPALVVDRELVELIDEAQFDAPLHRPDWVRELTTVERTEFDGRQAYRVRVVLVSGTEQFEFFDVETGLLVGQEDTRAMPGGLVSRVAMMRNYQQFGDLLQPTTLVQDIGLQQVVVRLTSYEYNAVPDEAFELPAGVKALIRD